MIVVGFELRKRDRQIIRAKSCHGKSYYSDAYEYALFCRPYFCKKHQGDISELVNAHFESYNKFQEKKCKKIYLMRKQAT